VQAAVMAASVSEKSFGKLADDRAVKLLSLETAQMRVAVTNFGGRLVSIVVGDRWKRPGEVLLGFDGASAYASAGGAFGAILGRNANRLANGSFCIDGCRFELDKNDRGATLHGGSVGFDMVLWRVESLTAQPVPTLVLSYHSVDGDQGFPGDLHVYVTYRVEGRELWLTLEARTTKPTVVSLSAHPYFNLGGPETANILDHELAIMADTFLPTDQRQIPTGELHQVENTPFDFRTFKKIKSHIRLADEQLAYGLGYDHYFVMRGQRRDGEAQLAARVLEPVTGRMLEVYTTQPGLQLYTGNKLNGSVSGRGGAYRQSAGFALEPQGFPDAPHHSNFPTTILRPESAYREVIGYRFGAHRGMGVPRRHRTRRR
jgi:aldose 1-epimerase